MKNLIKTDEDKHKEKTDATNSWLKSKLDKELDLVDSKNKLKVTLDESAKYVPVIEEEVEVLLLYFPMVLKLFHQVEIFNQMMQDIYFF